MTQQHQLGCCCKDIAAAQVQTGGRIRTTEGGGPSTAGGPGTVNQWEEQHAWVRLVVRSILSVVVHEARAEQAQWCGWQAMSVLLLLLLLLLQPPPPPPAAAGVAVAANAAAAEACLLPRLGPSTAAAHTAMSPYTSL